MITLKQTSITSTNAEAVVNPVEPMLLTYSSSEYNRISREIYAAAGRLLDENGKKLSNMSSGSVLVTNGYELKYAKKVFHVQCPSNPVPISHDYGTIEQHYKNAYQRLPDLENAVRSILSQALEMKLKSIAISTTTGAQNFCNMPFDLIVKTIVKTTYLYVENNKSIDFEIILVVPKDYDQALKLSRRCLEILSLPSNSKTRQEFLEDGLSLGSIPINS